MAVKLIIEPQEDKSNLPIEYPEIQALFLNHGVIMMQTWPDPYAPQ
jgi:hypothetical protein